jgi:hypothetical protein
MPTLAMLQGLPIHQPNALGDPKAAYPINASAAEVPEQYIKTQLRYPAGARVFHPVYQPWPLPSAPIGEEVHHSLHQ